MSKRKNDLRKEKICPTCGKTFLVHNYRYEIAKTCSRKCLKPLLPKLISESFNGRRKVWGNKNGYLYIAINGKSRLQHRVIVENLLKRKLKKSEAIHHKNHDRTDNRIENLQIMSRSEHARMSALERWHPQNV